MSNLKPMSLLLLEDDVNTVNDFKKYVDSRNDVILVATTASSNEALKLAKKYRPEGIIVDLELQDGSGSGFDFLVNLRSSVLDFSPLVVVNTNVHSPSIYKNIHDGFADLIFCKQQQDYSFELVINAMLFSRNYTDNSYTTIVQNSEEEQQKRISKIINTELDSIGINPKLKGRRYIFDAINFMINEDESKFSEISPLQYVASKNNMFSSSIGRGIQTAINDAWKKTPIEDLEHLYTAKVNPNTGVPSAMELVFFFYNKVKNQL